MIKYNNLHNQHNIELVDEFTVKKTAMCNSLDQFNLIKDVIHHFMRHPDPMVVPVYSFRLEQSSWGIRYSYTMKRLGMLSDDEKHLINYHGRHGVSYRDSVYFSLVKSCAELNYFLNRVTELHRYDDLHSGNILKDEDGNYRLIDLEGFAAHTRYEKDYSWLKCNIGNN